MKIRPVVEVSSWQCYKAVVTGILRVAEENLFSGLNNLGVYTLITRAFKGS